MERKIPPAADHRFTLGATPARSQRFRGSRNLGFHRRQVSGVKKAFGAECAGCGWRLSFFNP